MLFSNILQRRTAYAGLKAYRSDPLIKGVGYVYKGYNKYSILTKCPEHVCCSRESVQDKICVEYQTGVLEDVSTRVASVEADSGPGWYLPVYFDL